MDSDDKSGAAGASSATMSIAALRERGDDRFDPVRFRFIEAMARRAGSHDGEARAMLDDKVEKLLTAYGEDLGKARWTDGGTAAGRAPVSPGSTQPGALAALVDHLASQSLSGDSLAHPSEPKTLSYFRSTWSRLSADRRLTQSLATVPENAGPLNSHQLVHLSLALMRELSPAYLHRFMSYVDALLWLDRAKAPLAENSKKTGRGRSG